MTVLPSKKPHLRLVPAPPALVPVKSEIELSVTEYLVAIRQKGHSAQTIKQYGWHLARLAAWLAGRHADHPAGLARPLLREWGAGLYDNWEPATVKQAVSAARGWLHWLYEERAIESPLWEALKSPAVKKRQQRLLLPDEVRLLLGACDDTPRGIREAAIVSLLVDSGLRAAELCRLSLRDLNLDGGELKVIIKGGNEELGYFDAATVARLRAWLEVRPAQEGVDTVFTALGGTRWNEALGRNESSRGYPLTTAGLFRALNSLGQRAGVKYVSTHSFRRAFVCLLTEAGAPDGLIQVWGRWEDDKMVKLYRQNYQARKLYNRYAPSRLLEENPGK